MSNLGNLLGAAHRDIKTQNHISVRCTSPVHRANLFYKPASPRGEYYRCAAPG